MSRFASYGNLALINTGKSGSLKKLDNGYHELLLGAIGAVGNGGWVYDEKGCEAYLTRNADFLERLKRGQMKMEWGHPVREPGMSDAVWLARIHTILESNTCAHIRAIHLSRDTLKDKNGRPLVAIVGEIAPWGKQAGEFRMMLENPHGDVNSSVRSFTDNNSRTGRKIFTNVITWDHVTSPGIKETTKYNTPSMEANDMATHCLDQAEFDMGQVRLELMAAANDGSVSLESRDILLERMDLMQKEQVQIQQRIEAFNQSRIPKSIANW